MRELIVTQNITLDGVIDAAEGWFDASGEEGVDQSDVIEAVREEIVTTDALLVGRVTFEQLRGYWPRQADDPTGVRDHLNEVRKYVVSQTLRAPPVPHRLTRCPPRYCLAALVEVAAAQPLELAAVLRLARLHLGPLDQLLALGALHELHDPLAQRCHRPFLSSGAPMLEPRGSSAHKRPPRLSRPPGRSIR
jgi:hypothetical protein